MIQKAATTRNDKENEDLIVKLSRMDPSVEGILLRQTMSSPDFRIRIVTVGVLANRGDAFYKVNLAELLKKFPAYSDRGSLFYVDILAMKRTTESRHILDEYFLSTAVPDRAAWYKYWALDRKAASELMIKIADPKKRRHLEESKRFRWEGDMFPLQPQSN